MTSAYAKNAAAPAIIDRPSVATYDRGCIAMVNPRVASATDGADPKIPANVFGFTMSLITAKAQTTTPPTRNLMTNSNSAPRSHSALSSLLAHFAAPARRVPPRTGTLRQVYPMRRLFTLLLLLPLCLAACGSPAPATGLVTLHIWYSTDDPVERIWSQDLASRFQAAHPHVHVQVTDYSFEDMNTKLQLALSSGHPPDAAYVTPRGPGIPVYVAAHRLSDLTATARRDHWATSLRPGLLASYNQPFGLIGARPGHVVAVPMAMAAVALLYNARLLHRLHLPLPTTLTTFQHDLAGAKQAGLIPLGMGNGDGWLGDDWYLTLVNSLLPSSALQPELRLSPTFSFRQSPFLHAAAMLRSWSGRGYFTPDFGGLDAQEGVDLFFRGNTLFQLVSSSENPQITQDEQETRLPLGVIAFPAAYGGTTSPQSGYEGWVVPRAAPHLTLATSFINSLLTRASARFLLAHGVVPAARLASSSRPASLNPSFTASYLRVLNSAHPGVYLDAAPIANLNATMEANVQLLLQGYEPPSFLPRSLQQVYAHRGKGGSTTRIDGEF